MSIEIRLFQGACQVEGMVVWATDLALAASLLSEEGLNEILAAVRYGLIQIPEIEEE